jgi:hypothetical protein
MRHSSLGFVLVAFGIAGCSSSDAKKSVEPPASSSTATTKDLRLSFSAQCDGQSVHVYAAAFVAKPNGGGNKSAVLDGGDALTAKMGSAGEEVVLTREAFDQEVIHYAAVFPAPADAIDVTVSLVRPAGKVSAPGSIVHLPAPFQIVSTPPVSVKIATPLPVSVTPPPKQRFDVDIEGPCLKGAKNSFVQALAFDAAGNASFDTKLIVTDPVGSPGCDVTFYVRALEYGTVAPELGGGIGILEGEGLQQRSFRTSIIR